MKTIITLDNSNFDGQYYHAAHVEIINDNDVREAKYIDIKDLLNALSKASQVEELTHRIGKLPQYYFDGAIRRENGKLSGKIIVVVPKGQKTTRFEKTQYTIPFPTLLFYFRIEKGRLQTTQVFALKGKQCKKNAVLYNYPFGNVNLYEHTVCWGDNRLPDVNELQTLDVICSLFYDSSSNNDYYRPCTSTTWDYSNLREVYERLNDKKEFPEKILVKSNFGSIESLLKQLQ